MIELWCLILLSFASGLFYIVSTKQRTKSLDTPFKFFAQHPKSTLVLAYIILIFSLLLFHHKYGAGIALVSLCVWITPVLWILIIKMHTPLKKK